MFAVYDDVVLPPPDDPEKKPTNIGHWQPTPFIPWHRLPVFQRSRAFTTSRITLPCDQEIATSGTVS